MRFLLLILSCTFLFAQTPLEKGEKLSKAQLELIEQERQEEKNKKIEEHLKEIDRIEKEVSKEQVWMKSYASYLTSLDVRESLTNIKKRIDYLSKKSRTVNENDELSALISKEKILASQIEQLKEK
ncbi:MAG: mechanosensitive ion channel family protein, partial [Sulfurimonadaceae bacterium]